MRKLACLAVAALVCLWRQLPCAAADADGLDWKRRSLRQASPEGYTAVATLSRAAQGAAGQAALVCRGEGVELRATGKGEWVALAAGKEAARGALDGAAARSFVVKRTAKALLMGANGRWLYGQPAARSDGLPEVLVGTSAGTEVESFRLVAREQVRFADDFPDPTPKTGVWVPVCGQWALSSVTYADKSANPAELAAIFDKLEDVASRGRTREYSVGIGVQLGEGYTPRIALVANDSPAERAGLREGDIVREVDNTRARTGSEATQLLQGDAGKPVTLTIERDGKRQRVEVTRDIVVWGRAKHQVPILPFCQDAVALIVTGYDFWTDYHYRVAVRTQAVGVVGLVFAYLGPDDYHVFRWLGADKVLRHPGRWQLERVRGGHRTVLASRDGGFYPNDFFALAVEVEGDQLGAVKATCFVDSEAVLSAPDDALVPGRIGLWAEAPGVVCFDDVVVGEGGGAAHRLARGTRTSQQLHDPTMRYWADASYQWAFSGIQYWHKAAFPGDVAVATAVPANQTLGLTISATERGADYGYTVLLPEGNASIALKRAGKSVATKKLDGRDFKRIALAREGSRVQVTLDDAPCLDYADPQPLAGDIVGALGVMPADVRVESPNVVEDYFNGCPTEWHVVRGQWDVMNRWVCNPTWSFFGGRNDDGLLAIWSKRRLDGDCSVETDVGVMMMDRTGRYENMRDIGVSLCAKNQDLASGYVLIVGAYQNQRTVLYRCGKAVASTGAIRALLPSSRQYSRGELYSQHRGWFHIRLAKEGRTVRAYVWDNQVLSYDDPEPLAGGHAALWSVNNGVMVGKVRLAASRLGPTKPVLRTFTAFADGVLTNDCCDGAVRIEARDGQHQVTNVASGGPFAVAFRPRVFSAVEHPTLSFDIKLPAEAKVDLYFTAHGKLYRLPLSGPGDAGFQGEELPAPPGVKADGQWHRVSIDFLAILRRQYPDDELLMVWEPMLANFSNQGYLLAGIGGNGAGATYWLRNIAFGAPRKTLHASSM